MSSTEELLSRLAETAIHFLEAPSITRRSHLEAAIAAYEEWRRGRPGELSDGPVFPPASWSQP